jgi:hypothetical protein
LGKIKERQTRQKEKEQKEKELEMLRKMISIRKSKIKYF